MSWRIMKHHIQNNNLNASCIKKIIFILITVLSVVEASAQLFKQVAPFPTSSTQISQPPIVSKDSIHNITDTISITLADAEAIFVKNNYAALAAKYNVDAAYALVGQAKLFNNPTMYFEPSIYNKEFINPNGSTGKFFPLKTGTDGDQTTQGDFVINLNWTISLAQKRIKTANVAKLTGDVQKYQFDNLMRSLLFSLRTDFIDLYFGLESLKLLDAEIAYAKKIVVGFEEQYSKKNISVLEITRVRAMLFNLQTNRIGVWNALQQNSIKEFNAFLNDPRNVFYKPKLTEEELEKRYNVSNLSLAELVDQALLNRPDLKADLAQLAADNENIRLQKATGIPDLTLQPGMTRNSNYIQNDPVLGFGIPLPVSNRNQGNIKNAKLLVASDQQQVRSDYVNVQNDVFGAYQAILEYQKISSSQNAACLADFNTMMQGAESNFAKKNISLLSFVDIFDAYQTYITQSFAVKDQRYTVYEQLNFYVGKDVFKK
jgi:cobalt-zinc-cadmium efflux system outer membrane protein